MLASLHLANNDCAAKLLLHFIGSQKYEKLLFASFAHVILKCLSYVTGLNNTCTNRWKTNYFIECCLLKVYYSNHRLDVFHLCNN